MTELFNRGELREFLDARLRSAIDRLHTMTEDEVLSRSTDDLIERLARLARLQPVVIGQEPIDGGVMEGSRQVRDQWGSGRTYNQAVFSVHAVYEFTGDPELLHYRPSMHLMARMIADIGTGTLTVRTTIAAEGQVNESVARESFEREIGHIRTNVGYSTADVNPFNASIDQRLRPVVERRKEVVLGRRSLAGALGFPLEKRTDAPARVPMERKQLSVAKPNPGPRQPYRDEPALTTAQYEEVIGVVESTMLAMERTPSVASGKDEEELRDQILVQLNGAFKGSATGETFVQQGKTDLLVRIDDRHVFVGECKWWTGEKACGEAVDQLLSYLPWRDEKAALILFIDRKDASAVIEKADRAIRDHAAFKRAGSASGDPTRRRNFVLGQPDDLEREIHLAALFAVLPKGTGKTASGKDAGSA